MGYKTLDLTLISAKGLKNVNLFGKMDIYVAVFLSDEPKNKHKTPVHTDGGTNPSWNFTVRFTIDEGTASMPGKHLIIQLKHESTFGADKEVGEVHVPLRELLDNVKGKDPSAPQFLTYRVMRSGYAKGELNISYKLIDTDSCRSVHSSSSSSYAQPMPLPPPTCRVAQPYLPPVAYPPRHQQHAGYPPQHPPTAVPYGAPPQGYPPYGGYPPQPAGYGYPPTPAGYGYPPQPAAYGYPPPGAYPAPSGGYQPYPPAGYAKPQKPKKNSNFGMGLGAGLLGGAVGGLVLGEMMDDAFDGDSGFDL